MVLIHLNIANDSHIDTYSCFVSNITIADTPKFSSTIFHAWKNEEGNHDFIEHSLCSLIVYFGIFIYRRTQCSEEVPAYKMLCFSFRKVILQVNKLFNIFIKVYSDAAATWRWVYHYAALLFTFFSRLVRQFIR